LRHRPYVKAVFIKYNLDDIKIKFLSSN